MKKDIQIPEVKNVYVAVVNECNATYQTDDWNAYIINDKNVELQTLIIVSTGYSETKKTATFRKKINVLPAKSYAKIEMMPEELFSLNNKFSVTFFIGNQLFSRDYVFEKNSIRKESATSIPLMNNKGIIRN